MVFHCPFTSKAITERSTENGCDNTYRYHCMRTKQGSLTEQCLEISWIQDGKCAIYNADAKRVDAETCNENLGICPQKQYLSNDVTSYSACVNVPEKSSLAPTTHVNGNITTASVSSKSSNGKGLFGDTSVVVGIGVGGLIILVVFVVGLILYNCRKRAFQDRKSTAYPVKDGGDAISDFEENMPLTNSTLSNENCHGSRDQEEEKYACCVKDGGDFKGKENMPLITSTVSNENCHGSRAREEKKYDDYPYYTTKTYEHIENLVKNSSVGILIVGEPGSGKSVIAEMLYERFRLGNDTHCTAKILENLNKIDEQRRDKSSKIIFIIDDCFEDWIQYPHLVSTSLEQLQSVHKSVVGNEGNCLFLTMSKSNFESNLDEVQKLQLKEFKIVDLSTEDFKLDLTDKTGILDHHRKKKGTTTTRMRDKDIRKVTDPGVLDRFVSYLLDSKLDFEYPLSCDLFYLHDSFEGKQEIFFNDTEKKILEYVRGLLKESPEQKCQYCTLMYVVLHGGQVQALKTQSHALLEDIAKAVKIDETMVKPVFNYECCLITEGKDKTFKIVHEEITKLLFSSFGFVHTGLVIKKCNLDVLLKFIRTDDGKRRNTYRRMRLLVITNNFYELLAARLRDKYGTYWKHVIFQDEQFFNRFREITMTTTSKVV